MGLIYCAGGRASHFPDPFRQIATAILLKRSKKWPRYPTLLATIAQVRQPPSAVLGLMATAVAHAADLGTSQRPREEAPPPEAFLEFLSEWADQQGNVQDPAEFEGPKWQLLDNYAERHDETD